MIVLHIDSSPRGVHSVSRDLTRQLAHAKSAIEQVLDGCVAQAA